MPLMLKSIYRCPNGCRCDRCVVGLVSAICLQLRVGLKQKMIAALWHLPPVEVQAMRECMEAYERQARIGAGTPREVMP